MRQAPEDRRQMKTFQKSTNLMTFRPNEATTGISRQIHSRNYFVRNFSTIFENLLHCCHETDGTA
jgi:hypothetical protein